MIHIPCDIVASLSCPADVPQPPVSPGLSVLLMAVGRVHLLLLLAMGAAQREGVLGDQVTRFVNIVVSQNEINSEIKPCM